MGLLGYNMNEIRKKVKDVFKNDEYYLVTLKHNDIKSDLFKWLIVGGYYYTADSARSFIINFSKKGIYEKEISNSINGDFVLMPWHEIKGFELVEKKNKAILKIVHLGKKVAYEIPFKGRLFSDNIENLSLLKEFDWNRVE